MSSDPLSSSSVSDPVKKATRTAMSAIPSVTAPGMEQRREAARTRLLHTDTHKIRCAVVFATAGT